MDKSKTFVGICSDDFAPGILFTHDLTGINGILSCAMRVFYLKKKYKCKLLRIVVRICSVCFTSGISSELTKKLRITRRRDTCQNRLQSIVFPGYLHRYAFPVFPYGS